MGLAIDRDRFEEDDFRAFDRRLARGLEALRELLREPGFGSGPRSIGAELEVTLIDGGARPLPMNVDVLRETLDPRMTVELNRFNLECNLRPAPLAGRPFSHLRDEIAGARIELDRAAARHGGRIAMVGILPTLHPSDLQSSAMTDTPRYRALSWALQRARHKPFEVRIHGDDPLRITCDDVTFEGAATSLQVHLRVDAADFQKVFNAVQLATAPVLAVAGNSPTFLGHRLWHETRVALFMQAVDDRGPEERRDGRRPRVCFGFGWNQGGALQLFEEAVAHYPALLPVLDDEDPIECLRAGGVPRLGEIRLHQGTVWSWNRPVYDPSDGGHLRIEMRALPAGPSTTDMLANAAFLVGLALGLAPRMGEITQELPFEDVHGAFYRSARDGLEASLVWPQAAGAGSSKQKGAQRARDLIPGLLPIAREGLTSSGVEANEIDELLEVIEARCRTGITGAAWQRQTLERAERVGSRDEALAAMLERYLASSASGEPVHRWPLD